MCTHETFPGQDKWNELDAHKLLPQILDRIAAERDVARLKAELLDLQRLLLHHFDEETAPGGWFDELRQVNPANDGRIKILAEEHSLVRSRMRSLLAAITASMEALDHVRRSQLDLVDLIRGHCAAEHELALETYFRDEGCSA